MHGTQAQVTMLELILPLILVVVTFVCSALHRTHIAAHFHQNIVIILSCILCWYLHRFLLIISGFDGAVSADTVLPEQGSEICTFRIILEIV